MFLNPASSSIFNDENATTSLHSSSSSKKTTSLLGKNENSFPLGMKTPHNNNMNGGGVKNKNNGNGGKKSGGLQQQKTRRRSLTGLSIPKAVHSLFVFLSSLQDTSPRVSTTLL